MVNAENTSRGYYNTGSLESFTVKQFCVYYLLVNLYALGMHDLKFHVWKPDIM